MAWQQRASLGFALLGCHQLESAAAVEHCVCQDTYVAWGCVGFTYDYSYDTAMTVHGCQNCNNDARGYWCKVVDRGCAEEESSYGGGWARCVAPPHAPPLPPIGPQPDLPPPTPPIPPAPPAPPCQCQESYVTRCGHGPEGVVRVSGCQNCGDSDLTPWCEVVERGCAEEETAHGGGWAHCTMAPAAPSPPRPPQPPPREGALCRPGEHLRRFGHRRRRAADAAPAATVAPVGVREPVPGLPPECSSAAYRPTIRNASAVCEAYAARLLEVGVKEMMADSIDDYFEDILSDSTHIIGAVRVGRPN